MKKLIFASLLSVGAILAAQAPAAQAPADKTTAPASKTTAKVKKTSKKHHKKTTAVNNTAAKPASK